MRRLVYAAVVDPSIGELDRGRLHAHDVNLQTVDTAEFAEQNPVRLRGVVLRCARWGSAWAGE